MAKEEAKQVTLTKERISRTNTEEKPKAKWKLIKRDELTPLREFSLLCSCFMLVPFSLAFVGLGLYLTEWTYLYMDVMILRMIVGWCIFGCVSIFAVAAVICQKWMLYSASFILIGLFYFVDLGMAFLIVYYYPQYMSNEYIIASTGIAAVTTLPCSVVYFINCREDKLDQELKRAEQRRKEKQGRRKKRAVARKQAKREKAALPSPSPVPSTPVEDPIPVIHSDNLYDFNDEALLLKKQTIPSNHVIKPQ